MQLTYRGISYQTNSDRSNFNLKISNRDRNLVTQEKDIKSTSLTQFPRLLLDRTKIDFLIWRGIGYSKYIEPQFGLDREY